MPDITMCRGVGCPSKTRCYRALASPSTNQSWAAYDELRDDANPCGFFWDVSSDEDDLQDNGFPLVDHKED